MNILRNTPHVDRRHVLKGVGVSLALPFLDCMLPTRLAAAEVVRPRRSIFIQIPDGVHVRAWQIAQAGRNYTLSRSLTSLQRHRNVITPISGLYHNHAGGGHAVEAFLTGSRQGRRRSISVDQVIAQVTRDHTRFASLEIGGGVLSYNAEGIALPIERDPAAIFHRFFTEPGGGIAQQRRNLQRRGSMLDGVLDEARTFSTQLTPTDRERLQQYLTSVREVEMRIQRADTWLDRPRPRLDPAQVARVNRRRDPASGLGGYMRHMYDLIVLAFQTDMTRVVSFSTGQENSGSFSPEIGITEGRHALSHKQNEDLVRSDTYNIDLFSYFLDQLKEVRDAHGPLLDTTMALIGSQMSHGSKHVTANLPFVLAGGSALGLRHGSHIDFNAIGNQGFSYELDQERSERLNIACRRPVNARARHTNLLLTMAQKMGVQAEKFNDSTGIVSEIA